MNRQHLAVETVLEALREGVKPIPEFPAAPASAVVAMDAAPISAERADAVLSAYTNHGFAVLQYPAGHDSQAAISDVQAAFGLGEPFVPPMYRSRPDWADRAITSLTVTAEEMAGPAHPSFGRSTAQDLHSDGTLQEIGEVATTLLHCVRPAAQGGDTTLFNSVGAFIALHEHDPAAAAAMLHETSLIRTANIGDCRDSAAGPTFAMRADGDLISRYSISSTDSWGTHGDPVALARACAFFAGLQHESSGYHLRFALGADQCLIFANDKISHGRTAYHDDPARPRHMKRALFLARPVYRPVPR
ncbi:TauD/TfdA family dioxygenase [Catellatospora chokoriensis]|uniref:TauD/TfdA-like domain-containing protein n=1 Tax=Catellatospora chokoriensis TaxID=310353 RepID=A0A8J3NTL8_9ACTN|nr:TauD/TfdA family dioxygenase [Catellatospora chokoriensis]GIF90305.1 hypothetical protein Cch02nite_37490 [Catellatospora chokoriensis]